MPQTEMIINHVPGEECRIAIAEDGKLEEFYQERASTQSHVGNIYKGRVTNVEPAIQAAFVDFGLERNGFLHITDLHPKYFPGKDREEFEKVGKKTARHERPPIQKCLKRGQEVLVQVLKEGIGTKGPTVTSYLSIPGRFLVMMPDMQRLGVSRKVEDDDARKEMRDILKTLDPPKDFGFIVRTAGIGQTKADLKRDLSYLARLWKDIENKRKSRGRVGELYAESDLVIRTIRDVFSGDIDRIVCDDPVAARRARDFLAVANPRTKSKVVYYDDPVPVFDRMGIEAQIANISAREVPLPSGGALVIDSTEALVAVDVNSGKSRAARDAETNAYKTNLEAVDEIARQLRLRDLGGLVVLDLIDMRPAKNRKAVESRFKANLKKDRARTRVGPISQFGLLEMTRQRMRPSLKSSIYNECSHCTGRGYAMSPESVVLSVMRRLALIMQRDDVARVELTISPDVAFHILNRKRGELADLESRHKKSVMVRVGGGTVDHIGLAAFNAAGGIAPVELRPQKLGDADAKRVFRELDDSDLPAPEAEEDLDDTFFANEQADPADAAADPDAAEAEPAGGKRKRRRRRGRGRGEDRDEPVADNSELAELAEPTERAAPADVAADDAPDGETQTDADADGSAPQSRPGRRRRRGRGRAAVAAQAPAADTDTDDAEADAASAPDTEAQASDDTAEDAATGGRRRRRRRRGRGSAADIDADATAEVQPETEGEATSDASADAPGEAGHDDDEAAAPRRRRRRRRGRVAGDASPNDDAPLASAAPAAPAAEDDAADSAEPADADDATDAPDDAAPTRSRRKRRPRTRKAAAATVDQDPADDPEAVDAASGSDAHSAPDTADDAKPPRRRRGRKRSAKPVDAGSDLASAPASAPASEPDGNRNTAPDRAPADVDGNVAQDAAPDDADAPAASKKKPPRRAGRGYSNRVVY